jgi:hypothetical protein
MRRRLSTLLLVLLGCCLTGAGNKPEVVPQDITYCQLARDPSAFSGKRMRIRAIYLYFFEGSRLKSPTCCSDHDPQMQIWVDFDEELEGSSKRLLHKFPEGMGEVLVVFVGKIETGKVYGPFGERVRLVVDRIEKFEKKAKPDACQDSSWVPQNCEPSGMLYCAGRASELSSRLPENPLNQSNRVSLILILATKWMTCAPLC